MLKNFDLLPTPLNTANDMSPSGFANVRTGYQVNAGGLVLGDCFDIDNYGAAQLSSPTFGTLFEGRYRRIQVDANATAANVAVGKAAFVVPGYSVIGVLVATAGSGQTPGTYQIASSGGGGTGAIIQVVIGSGGTISGTPTVVAAGSGYTGVATFTLTTGGTVGTVEAQMSVPSYIVTDFATSGVNLNQPRGIFLNSITPGNYGWIQENGIATVQYASSVTASGAGYLVAPKSASAGSFDSTNSTTVLTTAFGTAIDAAIGGKTGRILMNIPVWNG